MAETYDILVVGAGPAGAALAARLAEGTRARICVLDAGETDAHRARRARSPAWQGGAEGLDWDRRAVASDSLGGRRARLPAGRGFGGSELVAPPVWLRPAPADFDAWGLPEWDWASVAAAYDALEARLSPRGQRDPAQISRKFAAAEGAPASPPDPAHDGLGLLPMTIADGRRRTCWDVLAEPLAASGRIAVRGGVRVARVLFRRWRAVGVELTDGDRIMALGGVALCAGPMETPAILLRSGVGPALRLGALGIDVAIHSEGVGAGLIVRPLASMIHDGPPAQRGGGLLRLMGAAIGAATEGRAALSRCPAEAGGFLRLRQGAPGPELEARLRLARPVWPGDGAPQPEGMALEARLCRPASRGIVTLAGRDPRLSPRVQSGLLAREEDRARLRAALRRLRAIFDREEFIPLRGPARSPGRTLASEEALDAWLTDNVTSSGEMWGGCAMGRGDGAPLDARLRLRGAEALWVCDSSAVPGPASCGLRTVAAILGWRGGQMIVEELRGAVHDAA